METSNVQKTLLFPCSGAADLGALSDAAARAVAREGVARMYCTAAVGAGDPNAIAVAAGAIRRMAVDGCNKRCAARILERNGVPATEALCFEEEGMVKGQTPVTEASLAIATDIIRAKLE